MLQLEICSGTSCHLMGCSDLKQVLDELPPAVKNQIQITPVACLGHCAKGPNIKFAEVLYHRVTPQFLKELIVTQIEKDK